MSFGDGHESVGTNVPFEIRGQMLTEPVHNYRFAVWVDGELIDIMKVEGLETQITEDAAAYGSTVQLGRGVKRGDKRLRELVGTAVNVKIEVRTGAQLGHNAVLRFVLDGAFVDRHGYDPLDAGGNQLLMEFVDLVVPSIKVEDL